MAPSRGSAIRNQSSRVTGASSLADVIELVRARLGEQGPLSAEELSLALGVPRAFVRMAIAELARRRELHGVAGDRVTLGPSDDRR